AGVNEKTGRRWLTQPKVAEAYRMARRQLVEHAIGLLSAATNHAVAALLKNLKDPAPPAVQIAAARTVLEYTTSAVEVDNAARLEVLERLIEERLGVRTPGSTPTMRPTPFRRRGA